MVQLDHSINGGQVVTKEELERIGRYVSKESTCVSRWVNPLPNFG